MVTKDPTAGGSAGKASIVDIEPATVGVGADHDVGGVMLEVVDHDGRGFRTIFDQPAALDVVLKVVGAVARLRRYGGAP